MKPLFLMTVVLAALMPSVPEPTNPIAIAFSLSFALLFSHWALGRLVAGKLPKTMVGAWLVLFVSLTAISLPIALLYETPAALWLRGAIPFFFLLVFFPAYHLAQRNAHWVLDAVHASTVVWLVSTAMASASAVPAVLSGEVQRITHATEAWSAFQLPYAMVGLAITLFHPASWLRAVRWPLAGAFMLMPLLAVSRGQIAAVLVIWLYYIVRLPRPARRRAVLPALALGAAAALLLWQSALSDALVQRFAAMDEGSESSRLLELRYAMGQFLEAPLLGKGLGHQIPADVTFAGDLEAIAKAGVDSVGYMHNVVGYLLMNLGLTGLIAYLGFVVSALSPSRTMDTELHKPLWRTAAVCVLALLWWGSIQASFRLIQSNVLLAIGVAVLAALKSKRAQWLRSHAQPG